jgi:hypothetical protein
MDRLTLSLAASPLVFAACAPAARGAIAFLVLFAGDCASRDGRVAQAPGAAIAFAPRAAPWRSG